MSWRGWAAVLLASAAIMCLGFGPPVLTERDAGGIRLDPVGVADLLVWASPPSPGADAALLVDGLTGQILVEKDIHERRPVASTTKIMTALLVLEQGDLDSLVAISVEAAYAGGNRVGFVSGEELSVRELLYGLLLTSGNDPATALAEHVGGSVLSFSELMNARARKLGLHDTHFVNPHGLDAEAHYSSAHDLWLLTQEALKDPLFREIIATAEFTAGQRRYVNLNQLLHTYSGADGVETGTTDQAGECLVASASRGGHRLIVVLLASGDRYGEATALLDYGFSGYGWLPVRMQGRALNQTSVGQRICRLRMEPTDDLLMPKWEIPQARPYRSIDPMSGEIESGGEFRLYLADRLLLRGPLSVQCGNGGE